MPANRAYLDYNATAPLRDAAREGMVESFGQPGNASSVHGEGRLARKHIEQARNQIAALVNAPSEGIVFTSGATEAAHMALTPMIYSNGTLRPASMLYVLETEHPCVLAGGRFGAEQVRTIPVLPSGLIDLDAFDALLSAHDDSTGVAMVAVQLVNSETGVIQPVAEVAKRTRFQGGYVVCDAVQAVGRIPVDAAQLGVDFLLLSAHKIGGPQGVGALAVCHSILAPEPAIRGGGQELNRRGGTENVAGIVGFGVAAEAAAREAVDYSQIAAKRDWLMDQLEPICAAQGLANCLEIFGVQAPRVGNTLLFGVEGLKAETALIAFDLDGVAVSSGSACSSGKVGRSHVLEAMGVDAELARGAIRISLGWNSSQADVQQFVHAFERITKRLGEMKRNELERAS